MSMDVTKTAGLTAVLTFRVVSKLARTGNDQFMRGAVVKRARNPDTGSVFDKRTRHLRESIKDDSELFRKLITDGYDGLIFFENGKAVGYLFWQKIGTCFFMFSLEVEKHLRGRHYGERLVKEFLLYIDELLKGQWLAYIGDGNDPAVKRICQKAEENQLGLPFGTRRAIKDTPYSIAASAA